MHHDIIDQETAIVALTTARDRLATAVAEMTRTNNQVVDLVVQVRPMGLLTVDEMATAVGRDRNYIDSVWSLSGNTPKTDESGRKGQTRVPVVADGEAARAAYEALEQTARERTLAMNELKTARAARDRSVIITYQAKMPGFGPSVIARYASIDRNHVLRIARRANVAPVHRQGTRNQHTSAA